MRFLLLLLILLSANAFAQTSDQTEVRVGFMVLDLFDVDNVKGTISGEFLLSYSWTDTTMIQEGQTEAVTLPLDEVTPPSIQIRNLIDFRTFREPSVTISPTGEINFRARYAGVLKEKFDFTLFPFDRQELRVMIFNAGVGQNFSLYPDNEFEGLFRPDSLSITNWEVEYRESKVENYVEYSIPINAVVYTYSLKRNPEFFIWKVVVPLVLVVFMSWSVFWIDPRNISAQLTVSVTAILTLIVFQFSVAQTLPELPYLTSLDTFIFGTDIFVFLAFLETNITSYFEDRKKKKLSKRIDLVSRYIFPVSFFIFLFLTIVL